MKYLIVLVGFIWGLGMLDLQIKSSVKKPLSKIPTYSCHKASKDMIPTDINNNSSHSKNLEDNEEDEEEEDDDDRWFAPMILNVFSIEFYNQTSKGLIQQFLRTRDPYLNAPINPPDSILTN